MNLDDCWQADTRDAQGRIQADPVRFPSGLSALGEYIHSKGLKFGIYSSAGFKTCQGYPASLGIEDIDATSYAEWGVDYLKYDNCYMDHGIPQNRYAQMAQALQATGHDIFYSLCEWGRENPAVWASRAGAQSWRISGDIRDEWRSIVTRAETGASLWRYSGVGKGWNDPDMLEIGNGGCSDDEYRTHFALWALLKAPLIIGNDIRNMDQSSSIYSILTNKEIIAVNQDASGHQGRIVWSDTAKILQDKFGFGERIIATQCASGLAGSYEDNVADQQWQYQADGTIKNTGSGLCLKELAPLFHDALSHVSDHFNFTVGLRAVTTADCSSAEATKWNIGQFAGGSIVSRSSGLCLEVSKFEYLPEIQGKRVQTGPCQASSKINNDKTYWDVHEHQSWAMPHNDILRNLYQRQCLTVDRDAFPGVTAEVWTAPLADKSVAALAINKGPLPQTLTLTNDMLQLDPSKRYRVRDLWSQTDLTLPLTADKPHSFLLKAHSSAMLKLSEI